MKNIINMVIVICLLAVSFSSALACGCTSEEEKNIKDLIIIENLAKSGD